MKATWFDCKGAARDVLRLGELPQPVAGPGEVLVRVHASAVNPSDVKLRSGLRGSGMPFPRIVPHQDGAGEIVDTGPGVPERRRGERVWLYMAQWERWQGTAAEYTAIPAERAVPLPSGTRYIEGACLGIPALTAYRALDCDGGVSGQNVLVQGGAGAVGWYAVQFAKRLGASRVVATVGGERQRELAVAAGADAVVDYRGDVRSALQAAFGGEAVVDRVIEVALGVNLALDLALLRAGGAIVAYASDRIPDVVLPFPTALFKDLKLRCLLVYLTPREELERAVAGVNQALADGAVRHNVAQVLALDDIVAAHEAQERGGTHGKLVLKIV